MQPRSRENIQYKNAMFESKHRHKLLLGKGVTDSERYLRVRISG